MNYEWSNKQALLNFLKDDTNVALINENRFDEIYERFKSVGFKRDLTYTLLEAGIPFLKYMTKIPGYSFKQVPVKNKTLEIPSNIEVIDGDAFINCYNSIEKIILHPSLKAIGINFFGYPSALKEIIFMGTEKEWKDIFKASNNYMENRLMSKASKIILKGENDKIIYKW